MTYGDTSVVHIVSDLELLAQLHWPPGYRKQVLAAKIVLRIGDAIDHNLGLKCEIGYGACQWPRHALSSVLRYRQTFTLMPSKPAVVVRTPNVGIRPRTPFSPQQPEYAAGIRNEPPTTVSQSLSCNPLSVPQPNGVAPRVTRAASPPDEPPGPLLEEYGLVVRPKIGLLHSKANIVCHQQ